MEQCGAHERLCKRFCDIHKSIIAFATTVRPKSISEMKQRGPEIEETLTETITGSESGTVETQI